MEVGSGLYGVLYGHHFVSINDLQVFYDLVIVGVLTVELVNEEDDGFAEFLGVAEVVLGA